MTSGPFQRFNLVRLRRRTACVSRTHFPWPFDDALPYSNKRNVHSQSLLQRMSLIPVLREFLTPLTVFGLIGMLSACEPNRQKIARLEGDKVADAFKEKCKTAGEQIFHKPANAVEGLFFQRDGAEYYDNVKAGQYRGAGGGTLGEGLVNGGLLVFAESPNKVFFTEDEKRFRYRRQGFKEPWGQPVNELQSEYGFFYKYITTDEERRLGLLGSELSIRNLESGELMARTRYFVNRGHRSFCGAAPDGYFMPSHFIIKALDLSKRYPSAWDKSGEKR